MSDDVLHSPNSTDNRVQKASQSPSNNNPNLNPRSCVTCRRRKVKCDKKQPCANCVKAHIDCIFPSPGRAPRKPRKPQDSELIERLKRLEGVVKSLGSQAGISGEGQSPEKQAEGQSPSAAKDGAAEPEKEKELTHEEKIQNACRELKELRQAQYEKEAKKSPSTGLENRFGRLVVDEGRSRYINPSFWANLSTEVEDIKGILNDSEDDDENPDYPSPVTSHTSSNHQGFIFGLSSQNVDMLSLHPPPDHVPKYWKIYKENVDPLAKILHVPSMEPTVLEAKDRLDKIHRGLEALLFAIYYGAVTSMWPDETRQIFGEDKNDLLARYRFGVEQSLARADFLQTDEYIVLQAFVIFLICLRRNDDARVIWTLTGLIVRMAQTLGIHRDGSHFNLPPFDIEMRRRLWWQICILDSRASEDHGCDPTIIDQVFDTQMPLNVNDTDLSPDMKELPEPKIGCTEMTFGLIRFEITNVLRRIQYIPPGPKRCTKFFSEASVDKKELWIRECHHRIEEKYLQNCDMSVPLYWVIATVSRLIMSKMWLIIYHPYQRLDGGTSLPQETRDKLFETSLENIEYSLLLETEEKTKRWGWLFRTYVQWHAIAFLLSELRVRTKGDQVERAWHAIEFVTHRKWADDLATNKLKGHLWKPLKKLMAIAKAERDKELEIERQNAQMQLQAQDLSQRLDPIDPIMSMDLGVDRLYPPELIGGFEGSPMNDFPNTWIDPFNPSMNLGAISAPVQSNGFQTSMPTTTGTDAFSMPTTDSFDWNAMGATDASQTSPIMTTSGSVDWENWDNLVEQFGMEVDQQPAQDGAPGAYSSTFGGITQWY